MAGHLIRRLHQNSTQVFAKHMHAAGFNLTPVQYAALETVNSNPGIDQAGIAAAINYDRATIGGVIDRLEQKGLVSRIVSARDRRAREIRLTKKGRGALEVLRPVVLDLQADILCGLDDTERRELLRLVQKAMSQ